MIANVPFSFFTLQDQRMIILLGPSLETGVQLYCFNLDYLSPTTLHSTNHDTNDKVHGIVSESLLVDHMGILTGKFVGKYKKETFIT